MSTPKRLPEVIIVASLFVIACLLAVVFTTPCTLSGQSVVLEKRWVPLSITAGAHPGTVEQKVVPQRFELVVQDQTGCKQTLDVGRAEWVAVEVGDNWP